MDPQFGDVHDISDRGEINLRRADHCAASNSESKTECSQKASLRPNLLSDNPMDLLLHALGKL